MNHLIYLASPYSHPDQEVRNERMRVFCLTDAALMRAGIMSCSPLSKHFITQFTDIPTTWEYWKDYCHTMLPRCDAVYVIDVDGWEQSVGTQAEIDLAKRLSIRVALIQPETGHLVREIYTPDRFITQGDNEGSDLD